MRITQWGEFGAVACIYLGKQPAGQSAGAQEIADALSIPIQYTQQILQRLRRGAIVESIRGPNGGYRLSNTPDNINLKQILEASEGTTFEIICDAKPIYADCGSPAVHCGLHDVWRGLKDTVDQYLGGKTLAALISNTGSEFFHRKLVSIQRNQTKEVDLA